MRKKHRQSNLRSLHSGLIDTTSTIQAPKTKQRHYRLPPSSSNHEVADVFQYATSFYLVYAPIFDCFHYWRQSQEIHLSLDKKLQAMFLHLQIKNQIRQKKSQKMII